MELFAGVGSAVRDPVASLEHTGTEGIGEHLGVLAADQLLPPQAEHPFGGGVDRHQAPVGIAGEKAVGEMLQGRAEGSLLQLPGGLEVRCVRAFGVLAGHCRCPAFLVIRCAGHGTAPP